MTEEIIVSMVSGLCVGIPTIITSFLKNKHSMNLINYKIDELTREVREHNNFAKRMPVLEEQMKVANHRINDLEKGR